MQRGPTARPGTEAAIPPASVDRLEDAYVRNAGPALRFAYFLTGDREMAQDLVQEAFVRVAGRLRHLQPVDQIDSYLRTTMINLFRSSLRRKRLERAWVQRHGAVETAVAIPAVDPVERDVVWRAMQHLPHRQRAAVILRHYEDLSEGEAARILGCSVRALNSMMTRAMAALRDELERGEAP
jgi:RNA polymerase sigma-70 factor (sigma-E family)